MGVGLIGARVMRGLGVASTACKAAGGGRQHCKRLGYYYHLLGFCYMV